MSVDKVTFAVICFDVESSRWLDTSWSEDARNCYLKRCLYFSISCRFETLEQSQLLLNMIEVTLSVLIN